MICTSDPWTSSLQVDTLSPMHCPNCASPMTEMTLESHHGRGIDLCGTCQAIWFDGYESLQLSSASVLKLFRLIGDTGGKVRAPALGNGAVPALPGSADHA